MDFVYWNSLNNLEYSSDWCRVSLLGTETKLTVEQRAILIKLRFPDIFSKKSGRSYYFKLCNKTNNDQ